MTIDIPIPATGWERAAIDPDMTPDTREWAVDSLIGAIAPAPDWLYETEGLARQHNSPMRLHPAEYARMLRASWATGNRPPLQPGSPVLGTEVIDDPDVPEGVVRITERPTRIWSIE